MLKFSLVVLFSMSIASLTVAASVLPIPPETGASAIRVAELG